MKEVSLENIRDIPKVELHRHVDGAVKPELVWELAHKEAKDKEFDLNGPEEVEEYLKVGVDMNMEEILDRFELVISVMQNRDNIEMIFREQILDLYEENIVYAELRFAPQYHTESGLTIPTVIEAALSGIQQGVSATGGEVRANLIVCIARETSTEEGKEVAKAALDFKEKGVVAIDLACDEAQHPPEKHLPGFKETFGSSLRRTVHAGEFGDQRLENIRTAVEDMRAERISHAIPLAESSELMDLCEDRGVRIESCPVSNVVSGHIESIEDLKLNKLREAGIPFTLNSDDPVLFDTSLSETVFKTAKTFSWNMNDIRRLMRDGAIATFLNPPETSKLISKLQRENNSQ